MIAITLQLTAGRYCATPWGRQVNEGIVEWPPSPWRFLRALVAVWRRTMPDVPAADIASLLHTLAPPPEFCLPAASVGHSRHYMPVIAGPREERALIFDAFVAVPRDQAMEFRWRDLDLAEGQRSLLSALLERLPYLGRAESWCRAAIGPNSGGGQLFLCRPAALGREDAEPADVELVPVLTADATGSAEALLGHLHADTAALRGARHDPYRPPGSRWVIYGRPAACLVPTPGRPERRRRYEGECQPLTAPAHAQRGALEDPPTYVARYAIFATVRPTALRTIQIGELARRALMSRAAGPHGGTGDGRPSWRFSGKDVEGVPLRGHQHVFYLPVDEDGDGFLDHLNICLRPSKGYVTTCDGFTRAEAAALVGMETLFDGEQEPLRLTLLHLGELGDALLQNPVLGRGRVWESATPYLLPRHPKPAPDGVGWKADSPSEQLQNELVERFGDQLGAATGTDNVANCRLRGQTWSWQAFRRWRTNRDQPPPYRPGLGVRLTFPHPIRGPIALGYGCHYGLGQFRRLGDKG